MIFIGYTALVVNTYREVGVVALYEQMYRHHIIHMMYRYISEDHFLSLLNILYNLVFTGW